MNFEFVVNIYKSVDGGDIQFKMSAIEVEKDPCTNCKVTAKASAIAMFVDETTFDENDEGDWTKNRIDNRDLGETFVTRRPCYMKFMLKNAGSWAGKALKLIRFDLNSIRRGKAKNYIIW